ncbi:helix-turn-helix transcriptional regulator [Mycobacterium shimoidei]|uniref:helix-turn-helix transcriptional regulator n=1 Tax=Mycobacterium shimoidei TaxID=29313 RepID=UPI0008493657|nr:LuxR family transcriptional regulator [Mycobacterium shimoidei]MCV7259122.1 LuxR family transcriptional regulator [Mycobacterium shimoidei]ODR13074.1 transcriptional regulator [Mycobacterium shimoidei]ORW83327.1 transcriptional regulator [Mycobacterium shimoidei]
MTELPSGTATLLLADVEGSTLLWETQPDDMSDAFARLDRTLSEVIGTLHGVRPVEQGEGDSFVVAFSRASDAIACALELQRAALAPIRLRIGIHSGEVQLRDEGNYIGPTINRTARIRDLAHGGQTVLSGATEALVADRLPADAWLTELGSYPLRGVPRPERVLQLCHPDIRNEFPPLRTAKSIATHNLPAQLSSFVGRNDQIRQLIDTLTHNRLVTLTGAGGVGKTRLAIQVASQAGPDFDDGVFYVDLAPITDPALVPVATARALGLRDEPGRSTVESVTRFIGERHLLMVVDNCEHLLDASAELTTALLGACPELTVLATSREPIAVAGEVSWRVPSLSLEEEAIELFVDRARHARPDWDAPDDKAGTVAEICHRLDGVPLAIELAAARVRSLSLDEILDGLHDRFRLLTGGARTAVQRQQTLRASVDWSHALLTDPERVLFRRLSVFMGSFDLAAAEVVASDGGLERHQVLDLLTLLVDKSLVAAEYASGPTRYRLLEMVRQYALEKLGESGEAEEVRTRHRDHYTALAARVEAPPVTELDRRVGWAETEIDNLRAAFTWSLECSELEHALQLASALHPFWLTTGRFSEGLSWFDAVLSDSDLAPAVWTRAMVDRAAIDAYSGAESKDLAEQSLTMARELGDPALTVRALTACGGLSIYEPAVARQYLDEGIALARELGDDWRLIQLLNWRAFGGNASGELHEPLIAAEDGCTLAQAIGDHFHARLCRMWRGLARACLGELADGIPELRAVLAEAETAHDSVTRALCLICLAFPLTHAGELSEARAAAERAIEAGTALGGFYLDTAYASAGLAAFAAGDAPAAREASEAAWQHRNPAREALVISIAPLAESAAACGDLSAARRWADQAVSITRQWHLLNTRARRMHVAIAQGEFQQAERDAYDALALSSELRAHLFTPDLLECLAVLAVESGNHREAARLVGAADAIRQRTGAVRFKIYDAGYESRLADIRNALGENDFEAARTEGFALSTDEAIAYALRGRGERKRPSNGWASLTPTELDVVRLVSEGLPNKDIAARLFVSPRTVQTHLTHVYTKLGLTSRVQLAQEAARHH